MATATCRCGGERVKGHTQCRKCRAKTLKDWRGRNRDKVAAYNAAHNEKAKRELVDALGGECACCGEKELAFLTLDHIGQVVPDNHRWSNGARVSGRRLLREIKAEGFPRDKYRILCWNCNAATAYGRPCPHEIARQEAVA